MSTVPQRSQSVPPSLSSASPAPASSSSSSPAATALTGKTKGIEGIPLTELSAE